MSISDQNLVFSGGEELPVLTTGRYLRIREATSPIYITINGGGEIKREKGEQIDLGDKYSQLRLGIRSIVAQSVSLVSAENSQSDNRNTVTVNASATVESGNDNQHLPKVSIPANSSAQLAAANAARKSLRVSLLSSALTYICLGKSGIGAAQGGTLEEGMVDYIDTTGALFGYNPSAAAVDVYVMEINKI
jgi:hypothetical protein